MQLIRKWLAITKAVAGVLRVALEMFSSYLLHGPISFEVQFIILHDNDSTRQTISPG